MSGENVLKSISFKTVNIGSLGQRAAKLLAVKLRGSPKSLPIWPLQPKCLQARLAQVQVQPESNHSQSLIDGNFAAL